MVKGAQVCPHVIKIIDYIERLASLSTIMDNDQTIDLLLKSLPNSYTTVIIKYSMSEMKKSFPMLFNMFRITK